MLLNPFRKFTDNPTLTEIAEKGWTLNADDPTSVGKWDLHLRQAFQNRPGKFETETFFFAADLARDSNALIAADDAAALAKVRGKP